MAGNGQAVIITKELWYKFTPEDMQNLGNEMATAVEKEGEIEKEKASAMADFKDRKDKTRNQIKSCAQKIRLGGEMRMIECREEKDMMTHTVRIFRNDSDEMVEQRPMTTEERQQSLFLEAQGPRQIELN
jgi:hypothetical protein